MPQLSFSRSVPFSAQQMLDLVADLNTYPDFVPNCSEMQLFGEVGDPLSSCDAQMYVSFGPINQSYSSEVLIDRQALSVTAKSTDNPFDYLDSMWKFTPTDAGCEINFEIDFSFSNRLIAAVAEPAFVSIQGEILDAFIAEAKHRYA